VAFGFSDGRPGNSNSKGFDFVFLRDGLFLHILPYGLGPGAGILLMRLVRRA